MISSCRSLPRRLESEPKSGVTLGRQLVLCNQENAPRRNLARDNCQRLWAACPKRAADADRSAPKQLPIKKQRNAVTKTVRNDSCVHPMLQTKSNKNYTIVTLTRVFMQQHTVSHHIIPYHTTAYHIISHHTIPQPITAYQIAS